MKHAATLDLDQFEDSVLIIRAPDNKQLDILLLSGNESSTGFYLYGFTYCINCF
jgi:hypothetical protein